MSNTATHAMHSVVKVEDPATPGTYVDITEKVSNAAPAFDRDNVDTSTFGQGDKTNIVGQRGATMPIDGFMDQGLRNLLWKIYLSDSPVSIQYGPEGDAEGKERQTADFNLTGFGDGGNVSSAVATSPQFIRTGPTTRDTWPA